MIGSDRSWKDPSGHVCPRSTDGREGPEDTIYGLSFTGPHPLVGLGVAGRSGFLDCPTCLPLVKVTSLCWAQMQEREDQGPPGDISRGHQGAR